MIAQLDYKYIKIRPYKLWSRILSYLLFEGRPLTTRGQWINRLVFLHFAIEKRLPQFKQVKKPVFILGTGRSGTTILGLVLSMHREVGFLNEPKALWHAIYPKEDLIGSYSRGAARYRLTSSDASPSCINNSKKLFGAYLATTFSKRLVDKYPELIFRVPFVKALFPDAKFLFLVRNGWDTCASIEGWSDRLGGQSGLEIHDWWGADRRKWNLLIDQLVPEHPDLAIHSKDMSRWTNHTDMAAVEWIITMRQGLNLLAEYPESVLRVNYESLCARQRNELSEISGFLSLEQNDEKFYHYAEEILQPVTPKAPFPLHPTIEVAFMDTMKRLGYAE